MPTALIHCLHSNRRRGPLNRRIFVFAFLGIVILLTVIDSYAPKPYQGYDKPPSVINRLPLGHFRDHLALSESEATSASNTAQPLPTSTPNSPLRDSLFPIVNPNRTHGNSWIDENHRQLKALFACIELDTCGPNQGKGMCTSPPAATSLPFAAVITVNKRRRLGSFASYRPWRCAFVLPAAV